MGGRGSSVQYDAEADGTVPRRGEVFAGRAIRLRALEARAQLGHIIPPERQRQHFR